MIWATVSSRYCFCWLCIASPSLTAKNIINRVSVLIIWWWLCRVISHVFRKGGWLWPVCFLTKLFALFHFVLQGQPCLLLQVSLDFLLLHPNPLWWKGHRFSVLAWECVVRLHETGQFQLWHQWLRQAAATAVARSRQSCPTLCDPTDGSPPGSRPWDSPGKNTGVGCHFLLQWLRHTLGLLWCCVVCLGNELTSFCHLWGSPKYCIWDSLGNSDGYFISSKEFLLTVVDIMVIWIKFARSHHWFLKCQCYILPYPAWPCPVYLDLWT